MATVKELREALGQLSPRHDDLPIEGWLPGSRVALSVPLISGTDVALIEGNLKAGSVLLQDNEDAIRSRQEADRLRKERGELRHMLWLLVDDIDTLGRMLPTTLRRAKELLERITP